jgi:hypothetical protein
MVGSRWPRVLERLAHQLDEAQAADRRVEEAKATSSPQGPSRTDLEPAEYQRLRRAYVRTSEYKAASREIEVAVVLMKVHDAALLRSARTLLARRADGKQPTRRLPKPCRLPGARVPDWWMSSINTSYAGIWRAIPAPGPELRLGGPGDPSGTGGRQAGAAPAGQPRGLPRARQAVRGLPARRHARRR